MSQMKELDKIVAKELNEIKISNVPDKEFKLTVIKVFTGLGKRVVDLNETFTRESDNKQRTRDE